MGAKKLLNIFRDNELPVDVEVLEKTNLELLSAQDGDQIDQLGEQDYIFTNYNDHDYISDVHLIRQNKVKMISSENVLDMKTFIESGGRAIIPPEWFESTGVSRSIISRFFGEDASIHLQDLAENTEITRFELFEHLRIGEISDDLVIRAFAKGFNPVAIRDWIEHVSYFSFYLHQAGFGSVPIELSSMQNDDELTLSISMNAADLSLSNFTNSFGHVNPDYPLYSLLETARISAHLFSIALYTDSEKVTFTAFWSKDFEKNYQKEQCFIIHEIDSSNILEGKNAHPIVQTLEMLEEEIEQLEKESNASELPGNIIELMASGAYVEENVQNVADHVQQRIQEKIDAGVPLDVLEDEITNIKAELLSREDAHLFEPFPEAEDVAKHIKRSEFQKNDEVERIREEHSKDEDVLVKGNQIVEEKLAQSISSNLEDESSNTFVAGLLEGLEEAKKILGDGPESEENITVPGSPEEAEESTRVAGGSEQTEENIMVKGYKELLDDELQLITNEQDKFDKSLKKHFLSELNSESDVLKLKSSEYLKSEEFKNKLGGSISKTISENLQISKMSPEEIKNSEESMVKSLQNSFQLNREDAKHIVKGTYEDLKKLEVQHVKSKLLEQVGNEDVKESYIKKSALRSLDQEKKKNDELKSHNQLLRSQLKSLQAQNVDKVDFQQKVKKQILEIEKRAKLAQIKPDGESVEAAQGLAEELIEVKQKMQMIQKEFQIKNEQLLTKLHEHEGKAAAQELLISKIRQEQTKKLSSKEQEIRDLKEQVRAALKNVNYGTDDDSKIRIEKLEIDKKELGQVIDAQRNDIKNLEEKVQAEREKRLDEREVKAKINRLEKENSAAQAVIGRLRKDMGQSHRVVDRQQNQLIDFRQIKAVDKTELNKMKEVTRRLEQKIKELEGQKQLDAAPEVDKIKASKKHLERKYKILEQQNQQLMNKIDKHRAAPVTQQKDQTQLVKIGQMEKAQKKLTRDLTSSNNMLALAKKDLVKSKNQENALNFKISQLEKELDKIKKSAA